MKLTLKIVSLVLLVFVLFVIVRGVGLYLLEFLFSPRNRSGGACIANAKQQYMVGMLYAADHDDRLPSALTWMDDTSPYSKLGDRIFRCSDLKKDTPGHGFAMNIAVSAKKANKVETPIYTPYSFESILLERNACSGFYGFPDKRNRITGTAVSWMDGHASRLNDKVIANLKRRGYMK